MELEGCGCAGDMVAVRRLGISIVISKYIATRNTHCSSQLGADTPETCPVTQQKVSKGDEEFCQDVRKVIWIVRTVGCLAAGWGCCCEVQRRG